MQGVSHIVLEMAGFCASVPGQAAKGWDGLEVAATVLQRPGVCRGPLRLWSPLEISGDLGDGAQKNSYPLVMADIAIGNHHFQWENQL